MTRMANKPAELCFEAFETFWMGRWRCPTVLSIWQPDLLPDVKRVKARSNQLYPRLVRTSVSSTWKVPDSSSSTWNPWNHCLNCCPTHALIQQWSDILSQWDLNSCWVQTGSDCIALRLFARPFTGGPHWNYPSCIDVAFWNRWHNTYVRTYVHAHTYIWYINMYVSIYIPFYTCVLLNMHTELYIHIYIYIYID